MAPLTSEGPKRHLCPKGNGECKKTTTYISNLSVMLNFGLLFLQNIHQIVAADALFGLPSKRFFGACLEDPEQDPSHFFAKVGHFVLGTQDLRPVP